VIDIGAICQTDATTVGDRVYSLYQAKWYPKGTSEGLSSEAHMVYYDLCIQSSDASVDLYNFCYGVHGAAYPFPQGQWINDCLGHKFF